MVEEIEDLKERVADLESGASDTTKVAQVCSSELETLTAMTHSAYAVANGATKNLDAFQVQNDELKMEIKSLKNMFVGVLVIGILYKFFM